MTASESADHAEAGDGAKDVLPGWLARTMRILQWTIMLGTWIATALLCYLAMLEWRPREPLLSLILVMVLAQMTVAIHEFGHFVGARMAGMTVLQAQIGLLQLLASRRGWRARISAPRIKADGYIVAAPDPARALKPQYVLFTALGPLANIVAGLGLLLLAGTTDSPGTQLFFLAWSVFNIGIGLTNLLPNSRPVDNDGLQLLRWISKGRTNELSIAVAQWLGMSIAGVPAERIPESIRSTLHAQPPPLSLIGDWIELKAAQNLGDWQRATEVESVVAARLSDLPDEAKQAMEQLLEFLRVEIGFSRAMLERDPRFIQSVHCSKDAAWVAPYLAPRLGALTAALTGNTSECLRLLTESSGAAEASVDASTRESESRLRQAIHDLLPRPEIDVSESANGEFEA